jgi:SSS family solute:Na+ symporter
LLKITPVFLMVLPGTVAYVILRDKIGDNTAKTLPIMITELMPSGLKGLMAAALMAALMSTIAAALNSVGTLVAVDIVGYFRPQASDAAQVRVGQISAVVLMLLAMAWSTQGGKFGTIFEIINKIPALFLAPPITTVFLWGVFWRRGTKQAAVTVLSLGLSLGFCLFLVDTRQVAGAEWISDERVGLGIPFMMQAVYMFVIWSVLYVIVSLATPAPPREQVENTTWPNPLAVIFRGRLIGWYDPRLLTAALLVFTLVLYWVFR